MEDWVGLLWGFPFAMTYHQVPRTSAHTHESQHGFLSGRFGTAPARKDRGQFGSRVEGLDQYVAEARLALTNTTDEHLLEPWRLLVAGHVAAEQARLIMLRDAVFSHLAHHRGQLTVYLRLNGAPVPALYGPSADEGRL